MNTIFVRVKIDKRHALMDGVQIKDDNWSPVAVNIDELTGMQKTLLAAALDENGTHRLHRIVNYNGLLRRSPTDPMRVWPLQASSIFEKLSEETATESFY